MPHSPRPCPNHRAALVVLLFILLAAFAVAQTQPTPATQAPMPAGEPAQPQQSPEQTGQQQPGTAQPASAESPQSTPTRMQKPNGHNEVVIKGGTLLTVTHGRIENGQIYIKDGKIVAVGQTVNAPATAKVIDATGKWITPGLVDSHSHIALDDDVNEATSPITPHMVMLDAFQYTDKQT